MMLFKKKYVLIFLFLVFHVNAQEITLSELILLKNKSIGNFQEQLLEHQFLFLNANKNNLSKHDSVSFINDKNVVITGIFNRKNNEIFIRNINNESMQLFTNEMKRLNYNLIDSEIISENNIMKKYINFRDKSTIKVFLTSDKRNQLVNMYNILILNELNFNLKYRKYQ